MLTTWQLRVVDELLQLRERVGRLEAFFTTEVFIQLPDPDKQLLSQQHLLMGKYVEVLERRVIRFLHATGEDAAALAGDGGLAADARAAVEQLKRMGPHSDR
jgi:hypothetical protein